jgi:hypothetical protein
MEKIGGANAKFFVFCTSRRALSSVRGCCTE